MHEDDLAEWLEGRRGDPLGVGSRDDFGPRRGDDPMDDNEDTSEEDEE